MKEELVGHIKIILEELGIENPKVTLDIPTRSNMGDYSTSVAMAYAKKLDRKPLDLAGEIKDLLDAKHIPHVAKIEVAAPGFLNFFFDVEYYSQNVERIVADEIRYGRNDVLKGKKTIVEYTDPNPFKEFHIGHLMSNSIGQAISNIIEAQGSEVIRVSYGGDVGLHVAKSIFAVLKNSPEEIERIKKLTSQVQLSFWAKAYVDGSSAYEENPEAKAEIDTLNKTIFDKSDSHIQELYEWGREVSIKHFQEIFVRLGTRFERNFWESEVIDDAMKTVEEGLEKGVLEKSEGAVIFRGENFGLHTRVFVNSKGVPTYEAKELGLGVKKMELYHFDSSIIITGNEQNEYFKVLLCAMELLRPEVKNKTTHIGHGMLRFADGKMSSRKGNVITGVTLLEQVKAIILEKMKDRELTPEKMDVLAEIIAVGAIKFSILKQAAGGDIVYDFEKSVSFEGDSGPYLQYAVVRANSLLEKAEGVVGMDVKAPVGWQTTNLERLLEQYPDVVARAGESYAPHYIVTYLVELAGEFNSFYASHKIIDGGDKTSPYRLALTKAFVIVMLSGLDLLGIRVPEEM